MSEAAPRLGIVGCGNVTVKRHIPAINRLENARVVAVADPVDSRACTAMEAADLPNSMSFDSFSAMADTCELDYVLVAVPHRYAGPSLKMRLSEASMFSPRSRWQLGPQRRPK